MSRWWWLSRSTGVGALVVVLVLGLSGSVLAAAGLPTSTPTLPVSPPTQPSLLVVGSPLPTTSDLPRPPVALPIQLPISSGTPTPGPSDSPTPTPTVTPALPSPVNSSAPGSGPGGGWVTVSSRQPGGGGQDGGSHDSRIVLPSVTLPGGALGAALVVAIATLPFLLGLGMLLLGRVWGETRRLRSGRLRMALAAELDLKPRELANLNTDDLVSFLGRADQLLYNQRSRREQELIGAPLILPLGAEAGALSEPGPRPRRAL